MDTLNIRRRSEALELSLSSPSKRLVLFQHKDAEDWMDGRRLTPREAQEILHQLDLLVIRVMCDDRGEPEEQVYSSRPVERPSVAHKTAP
jgi:hypothetical protein